MEGQVETSTSKPKRDAKGRLLPGGTANPKGAGIIPKEERLARKALKKAIVSKVEEVKKAIEEYEKSLAGALPELSPVLKAKALGGEIEAIKELHTVIGARKGSGQGVAVGVQINFDKLRDEFQA